MFPITIFKWRSWGSALWHCALAQAKKTETHTILFPTREMSKGIEVPSPSACTRPRQGRLWWVWRSHATLQAPRSSNAWSCCCCCCTPLALTPLPPPGKGEGVCGVPLGSPCCWDCRAMFTQAGPGNFCSSCFFQTHFIANRGVSFWYGNTTHRVWKTDGPYCESRQGRFKPLSEHKLPTKLFSVDKGCFNIFGQTLFWGFFFVGYFTFTFWTFTDCLPHLSHQEVSWQREAGTVWKWLSYCFALTLRGLI